jgi:hypothetical protein
MFLLEVTAGTVPASHPYTNGPRPDRHGYGSPTTIPSCAGSPPFTGMEVVNVLDDRRNS